MKCLQKKILLLLFSAAVISGSFSQPVATYIPLVNDSIQLLNIKNFIRQHYRDDSASLTGENKKYIINIYRERYQNLADMFAEKELMSSPEADAYLSALVNEIFKYNPELKKLGTRFLFSKVYWPNTFSTGEGTIVFNIGLFSKLKNESQAVFALCHELSHLYLDHGNKAIFQYVNTVYSEDFQQELKDIRKSKYEKNKQLDKLEKGLVFKSRRHGRQHESEADSMALVFMQRTPFNVKESLSCLALLDEIDKDNYPVAAGLQRFFNFPEYPFQNKWIKKKEAFFGDIPDKNITTREQDSLKTHPDCKVRIARLTPAVEKLSGHAGNDFVVNEALFNALKGAFSFEIIEFCFNSRRISRCLYYAMELFEKYPDNAYMATMIGKCLNECYSNQKAHTLNRIVDLPSPYADKNYNDLLEFIQNIGLDDMAAFSYYFLDQYKNKFGKDKDFIFALTKSRENFNNRSEK